MKTKPARPTSQVPSQVNPRPPIKRLILFFLAFGAAIAAIIGLTAILIYNSYSAPRHDARPIAAGVTVAPFVTLSGENLFPMGLAAAPDGTFYLTLFGTGAVMKVDAKGVATPWPVPNGAVTAGGAITVGPDNALYVIDFSSTNPRQSTGILRRITMDSSGAKVTTFGVSPNGKMLSLFAQLAFDSAGSLFVTNPSSSEVWKFSSSGSGAVWWTAPSVGNDRSQPTALAYDPFHDALIVGDAGTGSVYRMSLAPNASGNGPLLLYRQTGLEVQGVAVDDQGRVLIVVWAHDNGQLMRLETNGSLTMLADGFRAPTAVVYRNSKAYIVSSDMLGLVPPLFFGLLPSPLRARPPFTVDVVDLTGGPVSSGKMRADSC